MRTNGATTFFGKYYLACAVAFFALGYSGHKASAESGIASVYTTKSNGGSRTASGRPFRNTELTAAHRTLPFGSKVRVTNKRTGKSVVVTITDRGPFIRGRVIDLSMAGASAIGMGYGLAPVTVHRE
jgi:rare lipoprotein A